MIYQGAINTDLFLEFLQEKVLPSYEAFPGKQSVLIMDNASIYNDCRIQTACNNVGVLLQVLPPYPPDYNSIESTFRDLKAWIKANHPLIAEFKHFPDFLEFAIQQQAKKGGTRAFPSMWIRC
jgi:transposase